MKSRQSESKPRRSTRSDSSVREHQVVVEARRRGTVLDGRYRVDEENTQELHRKTGSCGQGSILVVRSEHADSRDFFALKMPISEDQIAGVTREIELWALLAPHPNIATLYDVGCECADQYGLRLPALLTPLAAHGNLENYIQQRPPPPDEDYEYSVLGLQEPICFCLQISSGLEFLHHQNVIHSDLKPKNVLVFEEPFNQHFPVHLKICDLGYSVGGQRDKDGVLCGHRLGGGTRGYAPPELRDRQDNTVTERCDTWGLVMCLVYAIYGCLPEEVTGAHPSDRRESFRQACSDGVFAHALNPDCDVSRCLQTLIADGLKPEPLDRPAISECSERLLELFRSADGDIESRCAPPDKTLALIPSLSKEREYLVALRVHEDEEKAGTLRQEWEALLAQEKAERSGLLSDPQSSADVAGPHRSLTGGEPSQDYPMTDPPPKEAASQLRAPPNHYVGCKRSAGPCSATSRSRPRR